MTLLEKGLGLEEARGLEELGEGGAAAVPRPVGARFQTVPSNWEQALIVCRKCSKKLGGGFGDKGKQSLAKALRKARGSKKGRKGSLGVVEVGCLGVCSRGAVTLIDGAEPGRWMIVPKGAAVEDVLAATRQGRATP